MELTSPGIVRLCVHLSEGHRQARIRARPMEHDFKHRSRHINPRHRASSPHPVTKKPASSDRNHSQCRPFVFLCLISVCVAAITAAKRMVRLSRQRRRATVRVFLAAMMTTR
jgi:hypothetical protein